MPVYFTTYKKDGYFVSRCVGELTDAELIDSWKTFFESDEWFPELNELSDLSEIVAHKITSDGIRQLVNYIQSFYDKHGISSVKVGIYAPKDLPFGLSRIYEIISSESPEAVSVFREIDEAKEWVIK